ncbi:Vegetative incompatibility protein HET-E-1 [Rhizoctonia solani AG-1 IB]|uniref:Vegetative incompatibility protein HET-E-1 n=1 Tax=Thanatephorus cucumeris (strain AG1-IB / isolate 7/3/14) TaxID=1108050 RepID=M5C429_THACB|nr:Vegetative incompatibility protein HET-E-1 [Rhizoctonia solani AG-1 IB]
MGLLSLGDSIDRSKATLKRWLKMDSKSAASTATPVVRDMWPSLRSLLAQLESSAGVFSPLHSAIGALATLVDAYEPDYQGQREYNEVRANIERILKDISAHMSTPAGKLMTKSVKLICLEIESEVAIMKSKQHTGIERRLLKATQGLDGVMDCCRRVHGHLERLTLNLNLSILEGINEQMLVRIPVTPEISDLYLAQEAKLTKMSTSMSATYNSAESITVKRRKCTPGTRKPQIDLLLQWANTSDAGKTCWMNGMAGTGKTTIAYTVCTELEKSNQLGASFFCSRTISECRQVKHIIPSIAYQLARFSLPFRCALDKALDEDSDAHARAPKQQYQRLIVEPLTEVRQSLPEDFIVVIDALDECENDNAVGQILDVLLSASHSLPIRYLISSRPEGEITQKMAERLHGQDEPLLVLHDLESAAVKEDIEAYMRAELKDISLDEAHWPALLKRCGVLFIYASTACRFIRLGHDTDTLDKAISTICQSDSIPMQHDNPIDALYLMILETAFERSAMSEDNVKIVKDILEMVICAIEPMTTEAIAGLLGLTRGKQVYALLKSLRSVLNIRKATGVVTTLHASFPDFMLSSKRSQRFCCDRPVRHTTMALACLAIVDQAKPKVNICALPSSYKLDKEIGDLEHRVSRSITPGLTYACRYWSTHLTQGEPRDGLTNHVHQFFESKLLLWMEVMNLTGYIRRYGTRIIMDAEKWCSKRQAPEVVTKLAHDAWQFVSIYANHPASQSTPHIYVSMLPFWPRSRPISAAYRPRTTGLVQPTGTAFDRRRLALIATWKVSTRGVRSISLSSDGTRLVVPTDSGIDVYDTTTGESVLSLTDERAQDVSYVAISPDGTQVAFVRGGGIPYLWDIVNEGKVTPLLPNNISRAWSVAFSPDGLHVACGLQNGDAYICEPGQDSDSAVLFEGHSQEILSVTFSPNGKHLASGSADNTVRVWDVQTGKPVGDPFEGHSDPIRMVSYSPDGSRLVSASSGRTVQVWDPQTGKILLGPLTGHSDYVLSATFSPNGTLIASGSRDRMIRVYDAQTGQTAFGPLEGHTDWVNSVTFSPDSTRLYSCSDDGTVRVWNMQDFDSSKPLSSGPIALTGITSIRYSPSGLRAVSGSSDGSVHVWDVRTGELVLGPMRGHEESVTSVDYSPSDQYIVSGSDDNSLRIWDANTGTDMHGPMKAHSNWVRCVRFSPDSSVVVSGSYDRTVQIWDVATGQHVMQLLEGDGIILSVGFSPDGHKVVCGSGEKMHVVDQHTGNAVFEPITGHSGYIYSAEFSPDGKRLVSGSEDKTVRIWDAQTGKQLVVCGDNDAFHSDFVFSVGFSPNDLFVASGSLDRTFSPDGSHVASCSDDGAIRFWDVSSCEASLQGDVEPRANKNVTPESSSSRNSKHDRWWVDEDGWVVDSHDRRLVWVPSELRVNLVLPPTSLMIIGGGYYELLVEGAKFGESWADCYQP